jgi:NitT/TauT family transport system permease protein
MTAEQLTAEPVTEALPRASFVERHRDALLGGLAVALFFAAWQAIFLIVPLNPLFFTTPSLIAAGFVDLVESGDLLHDLAVSAVPFFLGLLAAAVIGVPLGVVMGWRVRIGYALDPDIFAIDRMFACILTVMVIAVVLTEAIRWAERTAFPWRAAH